MLSVLQCCQYECACIHVCTHPDLSTCVHVYVCTYTYLLVLDGLLESVENRKAENHKAEIGGGKRRPHWEVAFEPRAEEGMLGSYLGGRVR